jgi:uncharacterized protein
MKCARLSSDLALRSPRTADRQFSHQTDRSAQRRHDKILNNLQPFGECDTIVYTKCVSKFMEFEWDESKNQQNQQKHRISFEEAKEIFSGVVFTSVSDKLDYGEIREISIGTIQNIAVIVVVHTDRNGKIRIISARKATPKERRKYDEYLTQTP